MKNKIFSSILFLTLFIFPLFAQLKLPKIVSDGMVLQRESAVQIWGWAAKNEKISIRFIDSVYQTSADSLGNWKVELAPSPAGGPYSMSISASDTIIINDILIGDVWICSGQSNMELPMKRVSPIYETEIANSENNFIRHFEVPDKYNFNEPQKDLSAGSWQKANPKNILSFTAVGYFFAKELYDKYKIPIGLINASLGGAPAEAFMSEEALKQFPNHFEELQKFKDGSLIAKIESQDRVRIQAWYKLLNEKDEGYYLSHTSWKDPLLNTSKWSLMKIPGYWSNTKLGNVNGVVWFRKEFRIPSSAAGLPAKLNLGRIVDADSVFVNGVFVGTTGYQYPPRRYEIPAGVLKKGKNIIVVRVINEQGEGGFVPDKPYEINVGGKTINLKGDWKYRLGCVMEPLASQTFVRWKPAGLYNAMIHPLLNFNIKGVIWYQGESNVSRAEEYKTLFPALINNWRKSWNQGDFPFLFVQLPNFLEAQKQPSDGGWARFREIQMKALSLPKTGMAVAIDLGEWNDVHPLNKKDVGKRLAISAQKIAYGDDSIVFSGPIYKSMEIVDNKIIISFDHCGSGLVVKGGRELKHFAIAGNDMKFVWAKAKIENGKVVVWNDKIKNPVAVRYAWANNPEGANLYNKEGLPVSPFRTDNIK